MSLKVHKERRKKKQKYPRKRSEKILHRRRVKRNIYKSRYWKIKRFPDLFKEISGYPFIIRREGK